MYVFAQLKQTYRAIEFWKNGSGHGRWSEDLGANINDSSPADVLVWDQHVTTSDVRISYHGQLCDAYSDLGKGDLTFPQQGMATLCKDEADPWGVTWWCSGPCGVHSKSTIRVTVHL